MITLNESANTTKALGPQFSIEPIIGKNISLKFILAEIDQITIHINNPSVKNITIAKCTNIITNLVNNNEKF